MILLAVFGLLAFAGLLVAVVLMQRQALAAQGAAWSSALEAQSVAVSRASEMGVAVATAVSDGVAKAVSPPERVSEPAGEQEPDLGSFDPEDFVDGFEGYDVTQASGPGAVMGVREEVEPV